ncbi:acylneuraminate cytidylyltransferase family protein [Campylobacter helveticus]|uniref:acylneuraminate cytidylyltransferase family protein n=1 Tax=Campylobacter helveticus TaxID=28898 RepID=UPI0009C376D1|nr:acylneuraminate cytidylyltransferase family protein [Campylobacter helveticus]ARE81216.1 CMP-legionaminic acid synthetase [Campylobacter helveticus]MCR2054749.1 acylneuraminate cytidylyltransferase family protein [Campylobacter helveticus]TNB57779.1 acylneuraminate cytidylyltransferase family protein [Campylobacter helveticus]TNH32867.1 acylneuraminate cytidylyltransferase family protein [Campylobacter helveticus]TXK58228.1 acylneuraminate cytidylyltransferase family protein [Campylobacter 
MILCTVCARGGSKGVKNKNIRKIDGLELIAYSIIQARESGLFKHIVISTDSDEIAAVAQKHGGEVFFKRDAQMASDSAAKVPAIRDTLLRSEAHFGQKFHTLIDLDATAPLRTSEDIKKAYTLFKSGDFENLITAVPARRNPYFNLIEEQKEGGFNTSKPCTFVCRQEAPKCYDMNASIYIFDRERLLKRDDVFGEKTALYVMSEESAFDIDSELDFKIVEFLLKERKLNARG